MYIYTYVCIYIFTYVHVCIYVYKYMYLYVYLSMYEYIYICIYIHIFIYTYLHTHTRKHTHTYIWKQFEILKEVLIHRFWKMSPSRPKFSVVLPCAVLVKSRYFYDTCVLYLCTTRFKEESMCALWLCYAGHSKGCVYYICVLGRIAMHRVGEIKVFVWHVCTMYVHLMFHEARRVYIVFTSCMCTMPHRTPYNQVCVLYMCSCAYSYVQCRWNPGVFYYMCVLCVWWYVATCVLNMYYVLGHTLMLHVGEIMWVYWRVYSQCSSRCVCYIYICTTCVLLKCVCVRTQ